MGRHELAWLKPMSRRIAQQCQPWADPEDLQQEALLAIWLEKVEYESPHCWIIARRAMYDCIRAMVGRRTTAPKQYPNSPLLKVKTSLAGRCDPTPAFELADNLRGLTRDERFAVTLYAEGLTQVEIGRAFGFVINRSHTPACSSVSLILKSAATKLGL